MTEKFSRSRDETREFARQFGASLPRGGFIALTGTLGAGKTEFVRGLCEALNFTGTVTSPTFSILNIYHGSMHGAPLEINHFDLYRLNTVSELQSIGYEDYFYGDGVTVAEWAEKFPELLPQHAMRVHLEIAGDHERRIEFERYSMLLRR